jgi:hypothetical protein
MCNSGGSMKFLQPAACEIMTRNQMGIMFGRGVVGLALMAWSFSYLVSIPLLGFSMLGISILLLKGCPACWGMHMVNLMRSSAKVKIVVTDEALNIENKIVRRKYQPKDMAEHLFPQEDVARFRGAQQQMEGSASPASSEKKKSYVC